MDYTDELIGSFPINVMKETECSLSGLLQVVSRVGVAGGRSFPRHGVTVLASVL
jgi:hypothetical protein